MNVNVYRRRGRPKNRWMEYVKDEIRRKGVSADMTADRKKYRKIHDEDDPI